MRIEETDLCAVPFGDNDSRPHAAPQTRRIGRVAHRLGLLGAAPVALSVVLAIGCGSDSGSPSGGSSSGGQNASGTGGDASGNGGSGTGASTGASGTGTSGGKTGSGGATGNGGSSASSGGTTSNGGASAGGATSNGGTTTAGGTTGSGGAGGGASGGTTSTGGTTGVSPADFPAKVATAACTALTQCLGAAAPLFFNGSTCADGFGTSITQGNLSLLPTAVQKGTVTFDASKVAACVTALDGASCSILTRRTSALCPGVLTGAAATGKSCSIDAECESGSYCKTTSTCPGTCTKLGGANAACKRNEDCSDGMICSSSSSTCVTPGKQGATCGGAFDAPCAPAYTCGSDKKCTSLSSAFSATAGKTCDANAKQYCVADQTCALTAQNAQTNVATWTCEPPATTTCHFSVPEQCPAGKFCQLGTDVDGTCVAAPKDGEACATRIPSDNTVPKNVCTPGATCGSDGKCHAPAKDTAACKVNADCYSGVCKSNVCVAAYCSP